MIYYVHTKGKEVPAMQTNRQPRARGIVVTLYRGKVMEW